MKGKFVPGDERINRKGRPPVKGNYSTEELRGVIQKFIEGNIETLQADFDKLKPAERLNYIDRLLKHVMPAPIISIEQFNDDDLQILLRRLEEKRLKIEN